MNLTLTNRIRSFLSQGTSGFLYRHRFKLPNDVSGDLLLQWYYLTGNSCTGSGYNSYAFPTGWENAGPVCGHIPSDGIGVPEQFWNCGEIYVGDGMPSLTPAPTPAPVPMPTPTPVIAPSLPTPPVPPSTPSEKTIVGYYASWQMYDRGGLGKPENLDFSKVDRVNFAFFQPDSNGNLFGTDSWGDPLVLFGPTDSMGTMHCSWDAPATKSCKLHKYEKGLISLTHAAGAKIYPSIGGWTLSDNFPVVAASSTSRTNFANQCVDLIKEYGFDGIDIDWEYPGYDDHSGTPEDKINFNLLLDEVRSKLDDLGASDGSYYGLTAALPCGPTHINNMDIPHISDVLDELLLMTYDLHGPWDDVTGVNAPLYYQGFGDMDLSVDSCVQTWKNGGAPSSKISLGLAFYGRSFSYSVGLNSPHSGIDDNNWSVDDGLPQYFNIKEKLPTMTSVRHDISKTPYAFFNNGNGFISYDDERSICEKTEYAIQNGLNGFLIWELTSDLMADLSTPLLDMVNGKLSNPSLNCNGGWKSNAPTRSPTLSPTLSPTAVKSPSETSPPTIFKSPTINPTIHLPTTGMLCPNSYTGLLASDTCSHFQYCNGGLPIGIPLPCPPGQLFDMNLQTCTYEYSVWCNDNPPLGVPLCPHGFNGLIAVNECAGFRHCMNGVVTSSMQSCVGGLLFDESIQSCNWASAVTCGSQSLPPSITPGDTESPTMAPTLSPTNLPLETCPSGYNGLIAVDGCAGFRHCKDGIPYPKQACAAGLLFDESIQSCNWAQSVVCGSIPTANPTTAPTTAPTADPTTTPTKTPTKTPTTYPTKPLTKAPTKYPTKYPTRPPTRAPTKSPTKAPTSIPSRVQTDPPSDVCPQRYNGLIAVDECTGFRRCAKGEFVSRKQVCTPGLLFDQSIQGCNWARSVTCENQNSESAPTSTPTTASVDNCPSGHTGYIAVDNCKSFRYCWNGAFTTRAQNCAAGLLFDQSFQGCNWASAVTCQSGNVRRRNTGLRGYTVDHV